MYFALSAFNSVDKDVSLKIDVSYSFLNFNALLIEGSIGEEQRPGLFAYWRNHQAPLRMPIRKRRFSKQFRERKNT